jgi:hypothetical protein
MTETQIAGDLYGLSAHPGDIYHRAAMTVEALIRERDEANAAAEAHEAKWQSVCKAERSDDGTCACSYDQPGDVCLFHSPKLASAEARIAELTRERDEARAGLRVLLSYTEQLELMVYSSEQNETVHPTVQAARAALKEPVASLREAGLAKPNYPNLEEGEHD